MPVLMCDYELPDEIAEIIFLFLSYEDLLIVDQVWHYTDNRFWRIFLKNKIAICTSWNKTFKFLGLSFESLPNYCSPIDLKNICASINSLNQNFPSNWMEGNYLDRKIMVPENEEMRQISLDCFRVAVITTGKPENKIMVFKRCNFIKEMEIQLEQYAHCMCLKNQLLFACFANGLTKIWNLETAELVKELQDDVSGPIHTVTYGHGILVTLSEINFVESLITTRHFTNPNEMDKTDARILPFLSTHGSFGFDGQFISVMSMFIDDGENNTEQSVGIHIWTVDELRFLRLIPDPEEDHPNCLKSSQGLLFVAYSLFFSIYEVKSGNCLRKINQLCSSNMDETICLNSEYLATACMRGSLSEPIYGDPLPYIIYEIKIWKWNNLCQESVSESECLITSIKFPSSLRHSDMRLICDSFEIVAYDGLKHLKQVQLIVYDFWRKKLEL